jgi:hypothetical protein
MPILATRQLDLSGCDIQLASRFYIQKQAGELTSNGHLTVVISSAVFLIIFAGNS